MRSNVIPLASRQAASLTTTAHELAAQQAHQDAHNALAMALYHLRANVCNVPGATRKAVQALAALNSLQALATSTGAAASKVRGAA